MRAWSAVLAVAAMLIGSPVLADPPEGASARVDRLFARWDKADSPGCAVAVMIDGRIVHERGYGMADLEHGVKISPESVFHVASMSKQFTAAAVLMLAGEGRLSLDDEARKYVPELPDFGVPITLRHLLHHTSGLRDQWDLLSLAGWRYSLDLITDADVLAVLRGQRRLNFPPGSRFLYSNTGFTLLAQIVKHASGESFRDFTTTRLFQPLGMRHTHFRDDHAEIVPGIAYGYQQVGSTFKVSNPNFDTVGATSLLTTVEDLAVWDENFYTAHVGGKALIRALQERGRLNDGTQIEYAAGLIIGNYRGLPTVDHPGGDAGYRSDMIRFPNQQFSAATLCNLASIRPGLLNRRIADIFLGADFPPVTNRAEEFPQPSRDRLAAIAGLYIARDNGDEILRLHVEDEKLLGGDLNEKGRELRAINARSFRVVGSRTVVDLQNGEIRPGGETEALSELTVHNDTMTAALRFVRAAPYQSSGTRLQDFAGVFRSDEIDMPFETTIEGDHLVLRSLKMSLTMRPAAPDLFASDDFRMRFARNPDGHVSGFVLDSDRVWDVRFDRIQ